ncbi:anti-sigma factor [Microbacterium sp. RG1]|uniref:anti-sigma factor n=1 Tax=Microbacterium sp. RG1 TaxID=2489212 RepID=UPI0010CA51FB|nr:anti-sigma factor [Microbacterium sp. RG1]QCQ16218.1 anti-sigma factor [Microbacterium sp. RG1]
MEEEEEFRDLAAGHALNALSTEDEMRFQELLVAHPAWDTIVAMELDTAAALADGAGDVVPRPQVRDALLSRIATVPQNAPRSTAPAEPTGDPTPARAPRRPRSRMWFALAASLAFILALGIGGLSLGRLLTPEDGAQVALEQIQDAPDAQSASVTLDDGASATAHWSASTGRAVLVTDGMPTLEDDKTFEMWFIRDGAPLPAGTFSADDAVSELAGTFQPGDVIAVTVEAAGGSPSGLPTTDAMFAITT